MKTSSATAAEANGASSIQSVSPRSSKNSSSRSVIRRSAVKKAVKVKKSGQKGRLAGSLVSGQAVMPDKIDQEEPSLSNANLSAVKKAHIHNLTNSRLIALPNELKDKIFSYILLENDSILVHDQFKFPALLSACKQVRQQYSPVYFRNDTFLFEVMLPSERALAARWLTAIKVVGIKSPRKIQMRWTFASRPEPKSQMTNLGRRFQRIGSWASRSKRRTRGPTRSLVSSLAPCPVTTRR